MKLDKHFIFCSILALILFLAAAVASMCRLHLLCLLLWLGAAGLTIWMIAVWRNDK